MTAFFVHLVLTRLSLLDVNFLLHVALLSRLSKLAFAEGIQEPCVSGLSFKGPQGPGAAGALVRHLPTGGS